MNRSIGVSFRYRLLLLGIVLSVGVSQGALAQSEKITWDVDPTEYFVYTGEDVELIDPFGYELRRPIPSPRMVRKGKFVPFFLSAILPNQRVKVGQSYRFGRQAPNFNPLVPRRIVVRGKRLENTTIDGKTVYHLKHEVQFRRRRKMVHKNWPESFCKDGKLTIDLFYDPELGGLRKISWKGTVNFEDYGDQPEAKDISGSDTYTLERHHYAGSNNFQKRVDRAIKKGVRFLKSEIGNGNNWKGVSADCHVSECPKAGAALTLLALLESDEVDRKSDLIRSGMKYVFGKTDFSKPDPSKDGDGTGVNEDVEELDKDFNTTYQVGLSLMAMESYYKTGAETNIMKRLRNNESLPDHMKHPEKNLHPADRDWVRSAVIWIFKNLHRNGGIRYPGRDGSDNSNAQYAALGLYAALNLQVIPDHPSVVKLMLNYWLKAQQSNGPRVDLVLGELGRSETRPINNATARGWSYMVSPKMPRDKLPLHGEYFGKFHSARMHMTAGAVGSVKILQTFLRRMDQLPSGMKRSSNKAIRDGFGWMSHNWQIRPYPTMNGNDRDTWTGSYMIYYMLYAIERAGMLNGEANIGGHDWYYEGSELLLSRPEKWLKDDVYTAFTILFLKRATSPIVETGPDD